ncbi:endonuclease/exonuclease/phosphatase family protein [Marivirga sp. S37H4]|uniref:Endonuclease/exonuclease/phosphatase family protein n=1 Tax=Marivirga aurantiaca TaxID=2802615 RepID=A0A934X0R5_9BACT|nr:endonuclease/exonuclease/phosphatase family protein [Marivirga aurantiaca]MBK6266376.1 endonuclease/exonuclease/phosphatase family protein [Marivirga aurantiaca]
MKRFLITFPIFLLLLLAVFYFWGSSSHYDKEKYDEITTYYSPKPLLSDTLKVMSYNIGYLSGMTNNLAVERTEDLFLKNLKRSRKILRKHQPDFIGFQEIDFGSDRSYDYHQLNRIANPLKYPMGAMAVNWDKSYVPFPYWPIEHHFGRMLSGQAVLSKAQVLSNELIVLDPPVNAPFYYKAFYLDRLIQIVKVEVQEKELIIMNVHLEAFDRETREQQAEYLLQVFEQYTKDYPVLLIGDFNSRPVYATDIDEPEKTTQLFMDQENIGEAISKEDYLSNESKYFTFDTADPYERLDYIFYNKDKIEKIEGDVLREAGDISDHLPVWMSFRLK